MNIYVTSAINGLKEKLTGYVTLLKYRYSNLCVKAELGSLLPATVTADKEYNLEDVAQIYMLNDYQMDIYPKLRDYLQPVIDGIFDVHPEFKLEIKQIENSNDPRDKHLLYTMPAVDKERHDLLANLTKVFYEEATWRLTSSWHCTRPDCRNWPAKCRLRTSTRSKMSFPVSVKNSTTRPRN